MEEERKIRRQVAKTLRQRLLVPQPWPQCEGREGEERKEKERKRRGRRVGPVRVIILTFKPEI